MAYTFTRTSPDFGGSTVISSMTKGFEGSHATAAWQVISYGQKEHTLVVPASKMHKLVDLSCSGHKVCKELEAIYLLSGSDHYLIKPELEMVSTNTSAL